MIPNFFIVGAARSGTTSLHRYLGQHPEIYVAATKEAHFFAANEFPARFKGPGDDRLNKRVIREHEQYAQLFAGVAGEKAVGESSAFYLCYSAAAERIAQAAPDAKIIILLRDPVDRAYSAYMYLVRDGRETLAFAEGVDREQERRDAGFEPMWWYKELSLYHSQVEHYLDVFKRQSVKVLLYDELCANPAQVLRDVFAFLGVRDDVAIDTSIRFNVAGVPRSRSAYTLLDKFIAQPSAMKKCVKALMPGRWGTVWVNRAMDVLIRPVPMNADVRSHLQTCLAEDVRKLEVLLGRDLWRNGSLDLVEEGNRS